MPAIPFVIGFGLSEAAVAMGVNAAITEVVGSTFVANAVTGSLVGATTAAITGGDVGKGALIGGIAGGIGGEFRNTNVDKMAESSATQYPGQGPSWSAGQQISRAVQDAGGSPELASATARGVGGGLGQAAGALATGASPSQAARQGLIGAGSAGAVDYASQKLVPTMPESVGGRLALAGAETVGRTAIESQFAPKSQSYDVSVTGAPSSTTGSQALSQALRIGDPGASLFGGDKEGQQRNVWNTASLKVKDETGA